MAEFSGGLKVQVYGGSIADPVSNALVTVFDDENAELYTVYTDPDGETEILPLAAPDPVSSEYPEGERPYFTYNAEIRADGYIPLRIEGIQIFPDGISLQNAPLERGTGDEQLIIVPAPALNGDYPEKIPEEEVKTIPEESGFVVLDSVVIPEFVIVHSGTPDSDAPDYYVPFKDYIKNVASSEIYSTWDEAAIRANVLAIISFTLNRVYTEWYRNKGYGFTITNSTAYDQSFEFGRTIFEEISRIVDETFTTYIKRRGGDQPLFAQYSDGREVVRTGWLSQWGSQELAQRGFNTLDILRFYYGDDIYLEQADIVGGVPLSYPGAELQRGSRGSAVAVIQRQLARIGQTYYSIGRPAADGIFGAETEASVLAFQQVFNLPQTGIVDLATWYQISQVYVALEKLAVL